jgi:hypothetical protein
MPVKRGNGKYGKPTYNQAAKIIAKFGGEAKLAEIVGCSRITAFRWQYQRPYGSDGLIPSAMVEPIQKVARVHGVLLTPSDWLPERINYDEQAAPARLHLPVIGKHA